VGAVPAVVAGAVAGIVITGLWIRWFPGLWARSRIDESMKDS